MTSVEIPARTRCRSHHLVAIPGQPRQPPWLPRERYIVPGPAYVANESRYPDLLVAFDVDPAAYEARNGYIVSEQGKAPDFILEVASRRTASDDLRGEEGLLREAGGEPNTGCLMARESFTGSRSPATGWKRSVNQPSEVREISPGVFQGYSAKLNLNRKAEGGYLGRYDPATEDHVPGLQTQTARADAERAARND